MLFLLEILLTWKVLLDQVEKKFTDITGQVGVNHMIFRFLFFGRWLFIVCLYSKVWLYPDPLSEVLIDGISFCSRFEDRFDRCVWIGIGICFMIFGGWFESN